MKKGWEIKKLDDACIIEYGTRVVQKKDGGTIYPVYGGGDATFFMDTFNREDCLVIARFAMSPQCTRFVKGKFFLNDSGLTVRPKNDKELLPDFLNLQMLFLNDHIYSLSRGTAQKNLDVSAFRNIQIVFPKSIQEQQRIVSILDKCFAAIDKAKANAEQNLKNARELFESYLQEVFEKKGDGWEEKKLGEVCDIINGGTPKTNITEYWGGDIHWITPADLGKLKKTTVNDTSKKITKLGLSKSSAKLLPINSVILSTRAPIGHLAINEVPMSTNQGCRGIVPSKKLYTWFLYYFLKKNIKLLDSLGTGATFKELSTKALAGVTIPLPSLPEQQRIVRQLDALRAETKKLEAVYQKKIEDLEELKKSILQKAFAGELRGGAPAKQNKKSRRDDMITMTTKQKIPKG